MSKYVMFIFAEFLVCQEKLHPVYFYCNNTQQLKLNMVPMHKSRLIFHDHSDDKYSSDRLASKRYIDDGISSFYIKPKNTLNKINFFFFFFFFFCNSPWGNFLTRELPDTIKLSSLI